MKKTRWKSRTRRTRRNHNSLRRVNLHRTEPLARTSILNRSHPKKASCHISWTNYARNPVAAIRALESASTHSPPSRPTQVFGIQSYSRHSIPSTSARTSDTLSTSLPFTRVVIQVREYSCSTTYAITTPRLSSIKLIRSSTHGFSHQLDMPHIHQ